METSKICYYNNTCIVILRTVINLNIVGIGYLAIINNENSWYGMVNTKQ